MSDVRQSTLQAWFSGKLWWKSGGESEQRQWEQKAEQNKAAAESRMQKVLQTRALRLDGAADIENHDSVFWKSLTSFNFFRSSRSGCPGTRIAPPPKPSALQKMIFGTTLDRMPQSEFHRKLPLETLKLVFIELRDKDGLVATAEFLRALRHHGLDVSRKAAEAILDDSGIDTRSGKMTEEEFVAFVRHVEALEEFSRLDDRCSVHAVSSGRACTIFLALVLSALVLLLVNGRDALDGTMFHTLQGLTIGTGAVLLPLTYFFVIRPILLLCGCCECQWLRADIPSESLTKVKTIQVSGKSPSHLQASGFKLESTESASYRNPKIHFATGGPQQAAPTAADTAYAAASAVYSYRTSEQGKGKVCYDPNEYRQTRPGQQERQGKGKSMPQRGLGKPISQGAMQAGQPTLPAGIDAWSHMSLSGATLPASPTGGLNRPPWHDPAGTSVGFNHMPTVFTCD